MVRINEMIVPIERVNDETFMRETICKQLKIKREDLLSFSIAKRSIDARKKNDVHYKFNFDLELNKSNEENLLANNKVNKITSEKLEIPRVKTNKKVLIVGSGPSGLFSAITLAKAGVKVIVVERGESLGKRVQTVENLLNKGEFKQNSNIQYGEGGAGTFSDGKLNTGINTPLVKEVLNIFYEAGAPKEILYDAKPHVGTDELRKVVKTMREKIISLGGEFMFETQFLDYQERGGKLVAYVQNDQKRELVVDDIILAFGYSARDTIRHLNTKGLKFKQKPFSVGYRIEHLQENINKAQYGKFHNSPYLLPADYKLYVHLPNGRTVYTFCMCPGGVVVPAMSEEGQIVTNGMSYHARDGKNANSAILVSVDSQDYESNHPLAGLEFQEKLEKQAFIKGKGKFVCSTVGDFVRNKSTKRLQSVVPSIKPCYNLGNVAELLPKELARSIAEGIKLLGKKLRGFDDCDAVLTGIETRSSAPFMIPRDKETLMTNLEHVYAVGEGAGMAGGIVSSAVDGMKIAIKIVENYKREEE